MWRGVEEHNSKEQYGEEEAASADIPIQYFFINWEHLTLRPE